MLATRREWREKNEDQPNAKTQRAQKVRGCGGMRGAGRVPEREEEAGWKAMITVHVTATSDNLSRYFLCSNDSNGVHPGRKLMRGMEMYVNLEDENHGCASAGCARSGEWESTHAQ